MTPPVEYTITTRAGRYFVAIDGKWATPDFGNVDDARAWVMAHARTTKQRDAGISECFGRGAQMTMGPRGGWRRFRN
jgi:hypothetical protein